MGNSKSCADGVWTARGGEKRIGGKSGKEESKLEQRRYDRIIGTRRVMWIWCIRRQSEGSVHYIKICEGTRMKK